ncbi:TPR repeat region-containing protein [Nocardia acidivorans]|uniref:TPR repeat region-containing protein n=1 Tax=Nocardia acidivorans TaxID=404580 RepID=UPI000836AE6C|nr:hypothetical protein [Nocardia acidivorans]
MGEAAVPTVSEVNSWQLDALDAQSTSWKQQSVTLKSELDGMYTTVGDSADYLVGKFGNGVRDKGLTVRDDGYKTVGALESAGSAIAVGSPGMRFAQKTVKQTLATLTGEGYRWAQDGTVSLSLAQTANALSDKDKNSATIKLAALQRQADLYTTTLKGALHAAGVAAQGVADGITNAFSQLPQAAQGAKPGSLTDPGTAKQQGIDDGKLVAGGNATDADLQHIAARLSAAGITPADVEAINAGQQVNLTEAQWNYLHEFYNTAGLNGLTSMTDRLTSISDTTAASTVANQLNTLANPNVHSLGSDPLLGNFFHPQGGLNQLPADLRNALTASYDKTTVDKGYNNIQYAHLNASDLSRVTKMMGLADARSAPGSQINTELLLQAAALAPKLNGHAIYVDQNLGGQPAESLLQNLVDVGGRDKIAVHDVLAGDTHLPNDIGQGKALDGFLHHHWDDDGKQVGKMLSWVESDATSTDYAISARAGQTASSVADYVAEHKSDLLHLDGGSTASLGAINPLAVQGLGSALSPYVPAMAGVSDQFLNTHEFKGLLADRDTADHVAARAIFSVIDTDKDAAVAFNTKALSAAQQLQTSWVHTVLADPANPHNELATQSGMILGLVDQGLTTELDARKATEIRAAIQNFANDGANWDTGKGIMSTGAKYIPVVKDIFGPVVDATNAYAKMNLIGYAYTAPDPSRANFNNSHDFAPARALYQVAQVLQNQDGSLAHNPQYSNLFTDDGKLKSYEDAARSAGNATTLDSNLGNILDSYRGGILKDQLEHFKINMMEGRTAIR